MFEVANLRVASVRPDQADGDKGAGWDASSVFRLSEQLSVRAKEDHYTTICKFTGAVCLNRTEQRGRQAGS